MAHGGLNGGRHCDLAILGGGVAGLACAIEAAQQGLAAVIVDRADGRLRPGECLHPGVATVLQRLGVGDAVAQLAIPRPIGMWHTRAGAGMHFIPYGHDRDGPWQGYQLRRSILVRLMAARAATLGVQRLQFDGQCAPILSDGRVGGLLVGGEALKAAFVIDAAGGAHWMARHLRLQKRILSTPLYARWGYARRAGTPWDHAPWLDMHDSGWTWRARVGVRLHAWVQLIDGLKHPLAPDMGADAMAICRARGADASWRLLDRCAGPGWMAVGDAAAVLDPISGDGVLRALSSAIAAATSAATALRGGALPASGPEEYDAMLRTGVMRRAEKLRDHVRWVRPA